MLMLHTMFNIVSKLDLACMHAACMPSLHCSQLQRHVRATIMGAADACAVAGIAAAMHTVLTKA
jgi:hypothetical protein